MKIIITLFLLIFTNLVALETTLVPYMEQANYTNSYKNSSTINGLYTKFKEPEYIIELDYETMSLENNITTIKQTDYTLSYSYFLRDNYQLKTTYHQMSNDANLSSSAKVYLLGVKYFKRNSFNLGLDISYSSYDKTALATEIYQLTPSLAINFGDYKSTMGKYIVKVETNIIYPKSIDTNNTNVKDCASYTISLTQFKGDFINKVSFYTGEEIFAVKDNGFSINNYNELYTSGYALSTRYSIYEDLGIFLSYKRDNFTEIETNNKSKIQRYLLLLDYTIK